MTSSERDYLRVNGQKNMNCARAIAKAIANNHSLNHFDYVSAVDEVLSGCDANCVVMIVASHIADRDWDGRYHRDVKAWAKNQIDVLPANFREYCLNNYYIDNHPVLIDAFATELIKRNMRIKLPDAEAEQNEMDI